MKNMLSLEAFADWAEKQPAEKEYDFGRPHICAAAQYLQSIGVVEYACASWELPCGWAGALNPSDDLDRTFGSLATRLRKASAP